MTISSAQKPHLVAIGEQVTKAVQKLDEAEATAIKSIEAVSDTDRAQVDRTTLQIIKASRLNTIPKHNLK